MSDNPELPFKRWHRERAEKEREAEKRRQQSERENQDAQRWAEIRTAVDESLTQIEGYRAEQRTQAKEKRPLDWAALVFVCLTTVFTGLTYVVFYRQLKESERAADQQHADTVNLVGQTQTANSIAQKHMRSDERAWIELAMIIPQTNDVLSNEPFNVKMTHTNFGKTPARNIVTEVAIDKLNIGEAPNVDIRKSKQGRRISVGVLYPGQVRPFDATWMGYSIFTNQTVPNLATEADVRDWKNGKIYFVIYGETSYFDIFGVKHWARYCNVTSHGKPDAMECVYTGNATDDNEE